MTSGLLKVNNLLKTRGCSDWIITNYISSINGFKNVFKGRKSEKLKEGVLKYLKENFIAIL